MSIKQSKSKRIFFAELVVICLILTGCHFNSTFENRESDKKDGEQVIAEFYKLLKHEKYKETYVLFDERFFKVTDTQKLKEIYDISFEKLGNIQSCNIDRWETQAIIGTDSKTNYLFQCDVKRSNYASKETIRLIKDKAGIKILSYHVNSDGLFKR